MSTISASTIQRDIICFQVQALNNVDVGNSTSFGDPVSFIDTSKVHFNEGGFTIASNGVTFPETGYYVIGASLFYQAQSATTTNDRVCPEMRFRNITQDSNMGTNSIAAMGYIRNLNVIGQCYCLPRQLNDRRHPDVMVVIVLVLALLYIFGYYIFHQNL